MVSRGARMPNSIQTSSFWGWNGEHPCGVREEQVSSGGVKNWLDRRHSESWQLERRRLKFDLSIETSVSFHTTHRLTHRWSFRTS